MPVWLVLTNPAIPHLSAFFVIRDARRTLTKSECNKRQGLNIPWYRQSAPRLQMPVLPPREKKEPISGG